jgi:IS4 transposase
MVAISSKLVDWGMKVGSKTDKKQIKYTIGLKGSFPCHVEIFKNKEELCEDNTIPVAIFNSKEKENGILVFDRGVQKRKTFVKLSEDKLRFVTRINTNVAYEKILQRDIPAHAQNNSVRIIEDLVVRFMNDKRKISDPTFRLIKAEIVATKEPIYFLTNITDMDAYEIAAIYKQRWQIEVFFKFLKQQLNLSHFISRDLNAIKINIYMTLIVAILIIAYQKLNNIKGYKITKLKMANELEEALISQIIILCGGNPPIFFKHQPNST